MQIQVILCFIAILGASAVALLCDFLRNKNQEVRQARVEMKVRRIEESRNTLRIAGPQTDSAMPAAQAAELVADRRGPVADMPPLVTAPEPNTNKESDMSSNQALSDWLIRRAAERAKQKTAAAAPEAPQVQAIPETVAVVPEQPAMEGSRLEPDHAIEPVVIDEFLWNSLCSTKAGKNPNPSEAVPDISESTDEVAIPGGFHDSAVLARLARSEKLFTGLVLSIGISQGTAGSTGHDEPMGTIAGFIENLLREGEFGCRVHEGEFLIVCPGETGVPAQRRLSRLSEELWDFQLRRLGGYSVVFSIGGIDVQQEALLDAISLANERMSQTMQTRKAMLMPASSQRKKAV